jgi:hypothetical protein
MFTNSFEPSIIKINSTNCAENIWTIHRLSIILSDQEMWNTAVVCNNILIVCYVYRERERSLYFSKS